MRVHVSKACAIGPTKSIESVTLEIDRVLPSFANEQQAERHYEEQATLVHLALRSSLPMATYHRLLIRMLEARAGICRGPADAPVVQP